MGRKLQLTENELRNVIKRIVEQVEDEYYRISPEEYLEMMTYASYNGDVFRRMKKYGGKPLYVTGDLSLSGLPVKDVGPISYVDGRLDISNTNVLKLPDLKVKGWISDSNTPMSRKRDRDALDAKNFEMDSLRQEGAWDNNSGDETGLKAHALLEWLEGQGELTVLSEEDKEKLEILRRKLQDLESEYEELEDNDDRVYEVQEAIDDTQSEIDELEENVADVYNMYPTGNHYGLEEFEVLVDGLKNNTYTVGTEDEMDDAVLEYTKSYVDDAGIEGMSDSYLQYYIDTDAVVEIAKEDYENNVRDSPESYFNDDDFELTEEQEQRINQIESQIEDLEQQKLELDSDDENYYDYEEDLDNQIETLQEELDNIEVDTEPTEDMIDNKVDELVDDVRRDPLDYLKNYGMDIKDYIDEEALIESMVRENGYNNMGSYDGGYDSIRYDGIDYYIMRIN